MLGTCIPFGTSDYDTGPKLYEDKEDKPLTYLQTIFNETVSGQIEPWAEFGLRDILQTVSPSIEKHINHTEMVCRMHPIDYIKDENIPSHIKAFDLTIRTFLTGGLEFTTNALFAFASTIATVVLLGIALIFALGKCFDTADKAAHMAMDLGMYTLSYINSSLRGALKMIPLLGPTLTKVFDMAEVMVQRAVSKSKSAEEK